MRRDEQITSKTLPNSVVVPPGLQVNELTLSACRENLGYGRDRMRRDEAVKAGFSAEEIDRVFGKD